jgi:hypothetical protein
MCDSKNFCCTLNCWIFCRFNIELVLCSMLPLLSHFRELRSSLVVSRHSRWIPILLCGGSTQEMWNNCESVGRAG